MSDQLKHECGIALIRLLKPLEYYQLKYGNWMYGLQKLYLLMEKQRNRGQDGAGAASVKLGLKPGYRYIDRMRSNSPSAISEVFDAIHSGFAPWREKPKLLNDAAWAKENVPFAAELYLGHLRYGTYGNNIIDYVQPVMRENNWKSRTLVLAGNFNMTNVDELFQKLVELGQHPKDYSDMVTVLEKLGHFLDEENQQLFRQYKNEGIENREISNLIADNMNLGKILQDSTKDFDGGYVLAGLVGHGDAFVCRDPWGIRSAFYYADDEIVVAASERPVIQTVMNVSTDVVNEIKPGYALVIKRNGSVDMQEVRVPQQRKSCSFERIYFSRGTDRDIYRERIKLGELLTPSILETIEYDLENTVFSFIPNTAETAFYGMLKGVEDYMLKEKAHMIKKGNGSLTEGQIEAIISPRPRVEKIAVKDVKLRTFISEEKGRDDLVGHVYDITYGTIREGVDNLVVIDDSIVRGTTLRESILRILDRLNPKSIVVVSSSPQVRYPDCYGIDMGNLGEFAAFRAAIELLKESGRESVINSVYNKCKAQQNLPKEEMVNYVTDIYKPFTPLQISDKIAQIISPRGIRSKVKIVFQTIENLHLACPNDKGDWYFTGRYPTAGGNKVVTNSFINFIEGRSQKSGRSSHSI
ncbi:MAG TPA: amidophosphoribosyltransferase [Tenuifilaceae bacterium]|jgi:amidophosphoribosyltransferase|nr:amidophosphoribosyltransferase [Bacteroidota bacterium]NLH57322.1 amidophosphoribosyltransferase [Rikenellaceae bacterium]OQC64385.1 MAG: Amidophosphoribosyltransferase [Bacteroidetes bacterium ADurb.Bin008]HNV81623.1 amidophosphoribosyltransferase [Tenuifilaceae bacterium]HOF91196.1 amidophosphoribosyltransferase [Tenuifilaceae bacterium]